MHVVENTLAQWLADVPESHHIYAVVSGVCETKPFECYQARELRPHFSMLYTTDPYCMWFDVMPRLVSIEKGSPFLGWCASQPSREWGWLLSSPLPAHTLVDYFSGLTQVITQEGKKVFFRYWDGHFFNIICNVNGAEMANWLPVVHRYWVNGRSYITHVESPAAPQESPWWTLPPGLMEAIAQADPSPVISNLLQLIKEEKAHLYFGFPEPVIKAKVTHFYLHWRQQQASSPSHKTEDRQAESNNALLSALCQSLHDDMTL